MKRDWTVGLGFAGWTCVLMVASCLSCDSSEPKPLTPLKTTIASMDDLAPAQSPGDQALLIQTGSDYLVDVRHVKTEDALTLQLWRHDEQFDKEVYRLVPGGFGLEYAAGETFNPPVNLLRFPMELPSTWEWTGTAAAGAGATADAKATVSAEKVLQEVCGVPLEAIKVEVRINSLAGKPIDRRMTFFFAKDKGLFKREFGVTSSREPACQ